MEEIVFASSTCSLVDPASGLKVRLVEGEAWWASDPFVTSRPDLFVARPVNVRGIRSLSLSPVVESAVAVPGVKRQVKRA